MKKIMIATVMILSFVNTGNAEIIYTAETSGWVFKDKINVDMFNDVDYPSIACYVNLPSRALDWDDQSNTALTCIATSPVQGELQSKKDVFNAKSGLFFKHVVVDRIYDKKNNTLVYMSYTKKMDGDNASSSISVVPVK